MQINHMIHHFEGLGIGNVEKLTFWTASKPFTKHKSLNIPVDTLQYFAARFLLKTQTCEKGLKLPKIVM